MTTTHGSTAQDKQPPRTVAECEAVATFCPCCNWRGFVPGYGCLICDHLVEEIANDKPAIT